MACVCVCVCGEPWALLPRTSGAGALVRACCAPPGSFPVSSAAAPRARGLLSPPPPADRGAASVPLQRREGAPGVHALPSGQGRGRSSPPPGPEARGPGRRLRGTSRAGASPAVSLGRGGPCQWRKRLLGRDGAACAAGACASGGRGGGAGAALLRLLHRHHLLQQVDHEELLLPALHDAAAPVGHLPALGPGAALLLLLLPPLRRPPALRQAPRAAPPALGRLPAPRGPHSAVHGLGRGPEQLELPLHLRLPLHHDQVLSRPLHPALLADLQAGGAEGGADAGGGAHRRGPVPVHLQGHAVRQGGLLPGAGRLLPGRHPLDADADASAEGRAGCVPLGGGRRGGLCVRSAPWQAAPSLLPTPGLQNPIDTMFHLQPAMFLGLFPLFAAVEGLRLSASEKLFRFHEVHLLLSQLGKLALGGLLAFGLGFSEFLLVSRTSSLTLSISGIFKEVCMVLLATHLLGDHLSPLNWLGFAICLLGISLHVALKAFSARGPKNAKPHTESGSRSDLELLLLRHQEEDEAEAAAAQR